MIPILIKKEREFNQCMPIDPSMMFGVRELQPNSEMKTYFKKDMPDFDMYDHNQ